jgi:polyketide synthase 12/myxalamid-type polyketide synthase MxaF
MVVLGAAPGMNLGRRLVQQVADSAGRVLGRAPGGLDGGLGVRYLGLDSLMALELRNRLQRSVGRGLRSTLAFDYPTIDAIAKHLAIDVLALELESASAAPAALVESSGGGAGDLLLDDIENLSDEEVERLFASRATGSGA